MSKIINTAETTIDFKVIATEFANGAWEAGLDADQALHIAIRLAQAFSATMEEAQICFDEDAFIDFATKV
jgi:hypothetical protein